MEKMEWKYEIREASLRGNTFAVEIQKITPIDAKEWLLNQPTASAVPQYLVEVEFNIPANVIRKAYDNKGIDDLVARFGCRFRIELAFIEGMYGTIWTSAKNLQLFLPTEATVRDRLIYSTIGKDVSLSIKGTTGNYVLDY